MHRLLIFFQMEASKASAGEGLPSRLCLHFSSEPLEYLQQQLPTMDKHSSTSMDDDSSASMDEDSSTFFYELDDILILIEDVLLIISLCPRRLRGLHLGSFLPSWRVGSKTYAGLPQTGR